MAFGDTPKHDGQDLCASCNSLIEVKGIRFREHRKECGRIDGRLPERVTSCTLYSRKNSQSLHEMHMMAWVLTLDQKKRDIGFKPPKKDDEDDDDRMWRAARKINESD